MGVTGRFLTHGCELCDTRVCHKAHPPSLVVGTKILFIVDTLHGPPLCDQRAAHLDTNRRVVPSILAHTAITLWHAPLTLRIRRV